MEVDAADVLRLVMQFLKEQGLTRALRTLQDESGVGLSVVDDVEALAAEVLAGRWDAVLAHLGALKLPPHVLTAVYEQIVRELAEARESDTARALLRGTLPLLLLKQEDPGRFTRLEHLANRAYFDAAEAYPEGGGKERRRAEIAGLLREHLATVPPARLVALLGQALKWQQHAGLLPPGAKFDLLRGNAPVRREAEDRVPTQVAATIKFGASAHAECAVFSPDGACLITGSSDGIIEVYDGESGKLRGDLGYQARDEFMLHDDAVLAAAVSRDSELLATGGKDGKIKVWRLASGECVRRFAQAHGDGGVTCLDFYRDGSQLLSGGYDGVAR
jgi:WD40 repeat-containing protein SMU1